MPDGSSSAAPVIRPGPRSEKKRWNWCLGGGVGTLAVGGIAAWRSHGNAFAGCTPAVLLRWCSSATESSDSGRAERKHRAAIAWKRHHHDVRSLADGVHVPGPRVSSRDEEAALFAAAGLHV